MNVNVDGGWVYLDGRLANFLVACVDHYEESKGQAYADDPYHIQMAREILKGESKHYVDQLEDVNRRP